MITTCAWCGDPIEGKENQLVSHGLCNDCMMFMQSDKIALKKLIDSLQVSVVVVDGDGRAKTASDSFSKTVDKTLSEIESKLGGQLIDCEYSKIGQGCGRNLHCAACAIRNSVTHTHKTGEQLEKIESFHQTISSDGKIQKIRVLVSTEKIKDLVLLRIDEIQKM